MTSNQRSYVFPMMIIGTLFFIFGFVTWLNNVLIPFLKQVCELTDFQAYFVTFAFYISYFVMAIPSSAILKRIGFARGMSVGLVVMAVGSLIFIPAAHLRYYPLFLLGLFAQGTGLTLLQTASNPYVTILGPIESAAKRISIMGVANKIAGAIGILLLVNLLFSDTQEVSKRISSLSGSELAAELDLLAARVITPYVIMAIVLFALAFMVLKAHLPEVNPEADEEGGETVHGKRSALEYPHLVLGVICIFTYVGVEVIAIDGILLYGQFQGFDMETAGNFGVYSLMALIAGYFVGIAVIPKYISQRIALMWCAILGFVFTVAAMMTSGWLSIAFIVLLSFAHAPIWPSIWPLAIDKLGRFTKMGSALLIMGIVGGALLPLAYGKVADLADRQMAYLVMLPCYLFMLFYAVRGYRVGLSEELPAVEARKI